MKKARFIFLPAVMVLVLLCVLRNGSPPTAKRSPHSIATEQAPTPLPAPAPVAPAVEAPPSPPAAAAAVAPPAPAPVASKLDQLPKSEQESLQHAIFTAMHAIEPLTETEAAMEQNKGVSHFATNPGQKFQARFLEEGGVRLSSSREGKTWQAGLRLAGPTEGKNWQAKGTRAQRLSRPGVTEWYENRQDGLEHGFTVAQRPENADRTSFSVDLDVSGLGVEDDRTKPGDLVFTEPEKNTPVLAYRDLKVQDATGRPLSATMSATSSGLRFTVQDAGAVYPVMIDPLLVAAEGTGWAEGNLPIPPRIFVNPIPPEAPIDRAGQAVALLEDVAFVGAPDYDLDNIVSVGAVYVFTRVAGFGWQRTQLLTIPDRAEDLFFGFSIAASGDTIIVGAPGTAQVNRNQFGKAYVFKRGGDNQWTLQANLTAPVPAENDGFGWSVALEGDQALVGSPWSPAEPGASPGPGAAYLFRRNGGSWVFESTLRSEPDGAQGYTEFGKSVAIQGGQAIVGAPGYALEGAVFAFEKSGTGYLRSRLTFTDDTDSAFGASVAISGTILLAGAPGALNYAGLVRQFSCTTGGGWIPELDYSGPDAGSGFGAALAFSGSRAAIGASLSHSAWVLTNPGFNYSMQRLNSASSSARYGASVAVAGDMVLVGDPEQFGSKGAAYLYGQHANPTTDGPASGDHFGLSVDLSGDTAVIGALDHDTAGFSSAGAAWVLHREGIEWYTAQKLIHPSPAANDRFGVAVAISGNWIAVGADYDDEPGKVDCGSVCVFEYLNNLWSLRSKLAPAAADAGLGRSVDVEPPFVVSGASRASNGAGEIHAWSQDYSAFGIVSWLHTTSTSASHQAGANFGFSIAISGNQLIVGEPGLDGAFSMNGGGVSFFSIGRNTFTNALSLSPVSSEFGLGFQQGLGFSAAMDGTTAVAGGTSPGGWFSGSGNSAVGIAKVYTKSGTAWTATATLDNSGLTAANYFGSSVAISGGIIAVGAFGYDGGSAGKVRLFQKEGTGWLQQRELTATGMADVFENNFGLSSALTGNTLLVGAYGVNLGTGSAYVYRIAELNALPGLNIANCGTDAVLTWPAGTGKALWRSPTMTTGSWVKVAGSESLTTYSYPVSSAPKMFFRLGPP